MEQIINLGKIPVKYRFIYKRTLQLLIEKNNKNVIDQHTDIIERIGKDMNVSNKIENFKPEDWAFTIDNNYNFLAMSKEYINKHFNDKGE